MARVIRRRRRNTDCYNRSFDADTVQRVWEKGRTLFLRDPDLYRVDDCGNIIYRYSYGLESAMGWEIDHKRPVAKGGTDHLNNLRPLLSSLNAEKGDSYPSYCPSAFD